MAHVARMRSWGSRRHLQTTLPTHVKTLDSKILIIVNVMILRMVGLTVGTLHFFLNLALNC